MLPVSQTMIRTISLPVPQNEEELNKKLLMVNQLCDLMNE